MKLGIVGIGRVGATIAYATVVRGLAEEIVLVDLDRARAEGEALDLLHGTPFARRTAIRAGGIEDLAGAEVVVLAAGRARRPDEDRIALVRDNARVVATIAAQVAEAAPAAVQLVVSNPVDVLAHVAWRASGLPSAQVLGSGTVLDTARLRTLLAERCGFSPRSVHVYVIGEHGDSELAVWSGARVGGVPVASMCADCDREGCDPGNPADLLEQTRRAGREIIARKGATHYAVALSVAEILETIRFDQRRVLTVSTLLRGYHGVDGVFAGVPAVVGEGGVARVLPIELDDDEREAFRASCGVIADALDQIEP